MKVRRLLILLLLVIPPVPVAAAPAWACSCAAGGIEDAELAFDGVVRSIDHGRDEDRVRFAVQQVVKGSAATEVTLTTSDSEASCGYRFEEGGRYRVYAVAGATTLCSGNELLAAGPGHRVERASVDRVVVFWAGSAAIVLIVAAALALLVRHRKPHADPR